MSIAVDQLRADLARAGNELITSGTERNRLAGNVQAAVDELIDDLATGAVGSSGASRVGVDAAAGAPNALPAGSVKSQLAQLLGFLIATEVRARFFDRGLKLPARAVEQLQGKEPDQ